MFDENIPWTEKYRPLTLCNIIGNDDIKDILYKYIQCKTLPNMLLYGPSVERLVLY